MNKWKKLYRASVRVALMLLCVAAVNRAVPVHAQDFGDVIGDIVDPLGIEDQFNEWLGEFLGVPDPAQEIGARTMETIFVKYNVQGLFRGRCGCALKGAKSQAISSGVGAAPEYNRYLNLIDPSVDDDINGSPNQYNNIMLGDSITALGKDWNVYTPGYGIVNAGVGGASSQDMREWLDYCASGNTHFWNKPHVQQGCADGVGAGGRFACNPPPGNRSAQASFNASSVNTDGRYGGYVQFQNRNAYLMIGGNDFNIELYRTLLQTFPVLIPFRHNNVANQINQIITYIQYQANTRVTLVGYMPFPSYYPGEELDNPLFNLQETLSRLGLFNRFDQWFEQVGDYSVVKAGYEDLPGGSTVAVIDSALRAEISARLNGRDLSGQVLWDCLESVTLSENSGFCRNLRGDQSWLSQRAIEINATMASVAAARGASMYSLYFTFLDYNAAARGCWWCGNKALWNLKPGASRTEVNPFTGRQLNDSIHPNELGYIAHGATLSSIMQQEGAVNKQAPYAHNDGCYIEPVDPGPNMACRANGPTWRLVAGSCVDTAPPPAPIATPQIVGNPNGPGTDHPGSAVTAPTYEPPPAPGVDDNLLLLIGLCFMFGFCTF